LSSFVSLYFFLYCSGAHLYLHSFPTRRSSDLIGAPAISYGGNLTFLQLVFGYLIGRVLIVLLLLPGYFRGEFFTAYALIEKRFGDRKSTRLNSSHVEISYAVFCLKKKKRKREP